jgi:adenylate cyclase
MAVDVVGYSRLMGRDESGTLQRLREHRKQRFEPALARYGGRLVKLTGDGALAEFSSAVDALSAAVQFQQAMSEANRDSPEDIAIVFRIGVHLGDLIVEGEDLYGDGVNVAARLEAEAPAGGIVVSRAVHEAVAGRLKATFDDLGSLALKNIERPVPAFGVKWEPTDWKISALEAVSPPASSPATAEVPLTRPDKASIAVMPFTNMSADPEQEYFADGIAEDVLTTLSKIPELMVIARNSSFVFKGKTKDVREIGRQLGARYVLEGSVRRLGNRVRLTAQLIDSTDGSHLWADRFEGSLDDVFELQDRITQEIVAALEIQLIVGEQARVWRKRSGSPLVYEHFLKGRSLYLQFSKHSHAQARHELEQALVINATFIPALYYLGYTLTDQARFGWEKDRSATFEAALASAERALAVDAASSEAYLVIGYVRCFQRRHDEAVAAGEKAISLMPSGTEAYHMAGMFHGYAGNFREAVRYEEQAQRLSPLQTSVSMVDEARARYHLNDLDAACEIALRVLGVRPRWLTAQTVLVAALWRLGKIEEAHRIVRELLTVHPDFSINRWARGLPYRRQEDLDRLTEPLREAGLPD